MKIFSIEGNHQRLDGGAMFGNAPREVWKQWLAPDDKNRIDLACRAMLIQTDDGQNVLCETGIGDFFEPKLKERFGVFDTGHQLLLNLQKVGLSPDDIDVVILSHLHFDHAGGLLSSFSEGEPRLVFDKAQFYVGEDHWQRATHPHNRDKASFIPVLNALLEKSGRLILVKAGQKTKLAPLIDFRFTDGHTLGLMHAVLQHQLGPIVFAADLIPGVSWLHLPITMGYDRFPEKLIDEKTLLLQELVKQNGFVFLTHDPKTALVQVTKDENGKFAGIQRDEILDNKN